MAEKSESIIINAGQGTTHELGDSSVDSWINVIHNFNVNQVPDIPNNEDNAVRAYRKTLHTKAQEASTELQNALMPQNRTQNPASAKRAADALFSSGRLVDPDSPFGQHLLGIRTSSPRSAIYAQGMWMGIDVVPVRQHSTIDAPGLDVAALEARHLVDEHRTIRSEVVTAADLLIKRIEATHNTRFAEVLKLSVSQADERISQLVSETEKRLQASENSVKAGIALSESFKYWSAKADHHRRSATWIMGRLAVLALAVAGGTLLAFTQFYEHLEKPISQTPLFLYASLILSVGSAYWLARLLTRQYMAHRHMVEDSKERATLIQTYIAMIKEQAIKPEQAEPVLKTIFRPATDGLIAGDSSPTLPSEIVAKVLDRKS